MQIWEYPFSNDPISARRLDPPAWIIPQTSCRTNHFEAADLDLVHSGEREKSLDNLVVIRSYGTVIDKF